VVTRTLANLVDCVVASIVVAIGYGVWAAVVFLRAPSRWSPPSVSFAVLLIAWFGALFLYFAVSWATTGRTYGGHLLGLRVVNHRGGPLRPVGALLRAAACVVLPIGLYWALFSSENRSVQDVVLRTSVIYDWASRPRSPRSG
jgi:uncharacterized RDD family membrane protein YckC